MMEFVRISLPNSNRKGEHIEKITTTAVATLSELAQLAMQLAILALSVLPNAQRTGIA